MHPLIVVVSTSSRSLVEPVIRAFAGKVKFVQIAPPPVPFCARVSTIPPHICQIGDIPLTSAPFVDLASTSTSGAIEQILAIINSSTTTPSLLSMGRSVLDDMIKWGSANFGRCAPEEIETRLQECKRCPYWDPTGFRGTGRCKKCGCSTWAKLKLKSASCPDGRWHEIKVEET